MKHSSKLLWAGLVLSLVQAAPAMAQGAAPAAAPAARTGGFAGPTVAGAAAGSVRVYVTAALREPLDAVKDQIPAAIGKPVVIEYGSARGNLEDEIMKGNGDFEAAILLPDVNEKLLAAGKILPETHDMALVPVAIGLRGDPAKPLDLTTPAGIKDAMLNAQSIKYAPTGAALLTVKNLFAKLELDGKVKDNSTMRGEAPLAAGQYEINLYPLSEIIPNKKLKNMGPVIPALQVPSIIQIVVGKTPNDMKATQAFIKFMQSSAVDKALTDDGMIKSVKNGMMK